MAILFSPIIEGKIPAQAARLKIYYNQNPMVGSYRSLAIRIKTISTNTDMIVDTVDQDNLYSENVNNYYFIYRANKLSTLEIGQFYKLQIAYVDDVFYNSNTKTYDSLYWSSVGIFKWTASPEIEFYHLSEQYLSFECMYQLNDPTEPLYSYELAITQQTSKKIIYKENNLIFHPYKPDEGLNSLFKIEPNIVLNGNTIYSFSLIITTVNGYSYKETNTFSYQSQNNNTAKITTNFNAANLACTVTISPGYIAEQSSAVIIRYGQNGDSQIFRGPFTNGKLIDYSILPDTYVYTLQWGYQENYVPIKDEAFSYDYQSKSSNPIPIDFEDMYLSDKDHLLRIRFNPKVGSFKDTILESKMETLGGKYPFFFRNGDVQYKEFSINGLISYHMDNEALFFNVGQNVNDIRGETASYQTDTFIGNLQLTHENFIAERQFKMAVLEWLNNGKPKLFRSAAEGAYIVRLMNVSLTPEDGLGRMLHSFSATAYEIDAYSIDNLKKHDCLYEGG